MLELTGELTWSVAGFCVCIAPLTTLGGGRGLLGEDCGDARWGGGGLASIEEFLGGGGGAGRLVLLAIATSLGLVHSLCLRHRIEYK